MNRTSQSEFTANGFHHFRSVLSQQSVVELRRALPDLKKKGDPGARILLSRIPMVRRLASSPVIHNLLADLSQDHLTPVRSLLLDKYAGANWFVPWHQDRAIHVRTKHEVSGFENWTQKTGTFQVEPPIALLETMVTLRIHLDDAVEENGPLRVLPGSHLDGRLSGNELASRSEANPVTLTAKAGDVIAMRPLLGHASNKSVSTNRRCILHIEYADRAALPHPLEWAEG